MKHGLAWSVVFSAILLLWPAAGVPGAGLDDILAGGGDTADALNALVQDTEKEGSKKDLALLKNSFFGDLSYWNGVDREDFGVKERQGILADNSDPWGWRFNKDKGSMERLPGKTIPISALLAVPETGPYRLWMRRMADTVRPYPVALKISGANKLEHTFGQFTLTSDLSKNQEKTLPVRFENEAIRSTFPSAACQVWEYWDTDLAKGNSLFELSSIRDDARFSHLFISASKTFTPRLPREPYNTLLSLEQQQESTLSRVYYRFRVREAGVAKCRVKAARMRYLWKFDPHNDTFGEGIQGVGLAQKSLLDRASPVPLSASGKPDIPCGEWTAWLDATWASQGSGPFGAASLEFDRLDTGQCDVELAWHPDPAAVVKTITVGIEEGIAKFCVPLIYRGKGKIVFPDRKNQKGVWGVYGQNTLDRLKTMEGFNQQYLAWIKEAKEKLGITRDPQLPPGVKLVAGIEGNRSEQIALGKTLVSMGFNRFTEMAPDICKEVGVEPLFTGGSYASHTSDPADPARPIIIRRMLESMLKQGEQTIPGYAQLLHIINVGDEIGCIAGLYKINQSVECRKRFRQYLARVLKEKQQTPAFFGVESLEDLECMEGIPRDPGIFERRLYNHSVKFRQELTGDYYQPITDIGKELFPNVLTYANYSPAPLRQGEQVHSLTWFALLRQGALSLAWGEDWVYNIGSFTGYEIVSYYAAMVECAARALKCPSGFYNVAGGSVLRSDTHIISTLSRNIKYIYVFSFGPAYNTSMSEWEGAWSDTPFVYTDLIKAFHVAAHIGRPLAEGTVEERQVALLYNRDHEIMHGGHQGEQSDRSLVFAALGNCHRNADLILNEDLTPEVLKQYRALFINGYCLPRAAAPAIKQWVEAGGLLVATASSATRDEYDTPLPEMEEVFGARQCGRSMSRGYFSPIHIYSHRPIDTITLRETEFSPALTAAVIGVKTVLQPTTAQPIAAFADGSCAAALNTLGKGYVLLWGVQPGFIYKGQREGVKGYVEEMSRYVDERLAIFEKPLRRVMGESPLSTDAPQVELTRFELGGETGILVNNFKRYAWTTNLPPMTVKIKMAGGREIKTASSALAGELKWTQAGDWITVTAPLPATVDSLLLK